MKEEDKQYFLAEYTALRSELNQRIANIAQIYSFYIAAILIIIGFSIEKGFYDILLAIPIFAWTVFLQLYWNDIVILRIGDHISKLAHYIFHQNGNTDAFTWDTRFWDPGVKNNAWRHSVVFLFSVCSVTPGIIYSAYFIYCLWKGAILPGKTLSSVPRSISAIVVVSLLGWAIYVFFAVIHLTFHHKRYFVVLPKEEASTSVSPGA